MSTPVPSAQPTAVLIPARDEGPRVGGTVRAVRAVLPRAVVVVVDSGSRDDTALQAQAAGAQVVAQSGSGYAGALLCGYRHLLQLGVTRVVQLDADGQHPPAVAPALLAALSPSHHIVFGSRHGTGSPGAAPRRLANHALSWLVFALAGRRLHDVTSGFWALDRHAMSTLCAHVASDCADANVRVLALRRGLEPIELPVSMPARLDGESMHDGWSGIRNLGTSVRRAVEASGRLRWQAAEVPDEPGLAKGGDVSLRVG